MADEKQGSTSSAEKAKAEEPTTYPVDRLQREAFDRFGVEPHVAAGAFDGLAKKNLTLEEAETRIKDWLRSPVRVDPATAPGEEEEAMPGDFSKSALPELAGTYFHVDTQLPSLPTPNAASTVALGITHTWGPFETATPVGSLGDFLGKFGGDPSNPSPGYNAVRMAFRGQDFEEWGGAGQVIVYRMGGASAAKATRSLTNTTPATALTVTARYEGTTGNTLSLVVQDKPGDATRNQLLVYQGSQLLETWDHLDTDIAGLAAAINAGSSWITAVANVTGVALTMNAGAALTGGNDGATLLAGDYTALMAALEVQEFGVLSFENLTDSSILASIKSWAQAQNAAGRKFFTSVGGALSETTTDALGRAAALADPDFITATVGRVQDDTMLDASGVPLIFSSAQIAPRIAGILAFRGTRHSLTYAKVSGWRILDGSPAADLTKLFDGGVIPLLRTSDPTALARLGNETTTYVSTTDPKKPARVYRVPKYVSTIHTIQRVLQAWYDDNIIGETEVDDATRKAAIAHANDVMAELQSQRQVQAGWGVQVDPVPPPTDDDDFIALLIDAKFGRSTEKVFITAKLG